MQLGLFALVQMGLKVFGYSKITCLDFTKAAQISVYVKVCVCLGGVV